MQEGGVLDVCWTSFNCQSAWRSTVCPVLLSLSLLIPCLSLPLLHFPYVCMCVCECLFLTKFVGIFVLCSVTFILCPFFLRASACCFVFFCLVRFVRSAIHNCRFICYSKLFLSIADETPKLHRKKDEKKKQRERKLLLCMAKFARE